MITLPSGFSPLNFVGELSTQTIYFDTGIKPTNTMNIDAMFVCEGTNAFLFGARNTAQNTSAGQTWVGLESSNLSFGFASTRTTYNDAIYLGNTFSYRKRGNCITTVALGRVSYTEITDVTFVGTQNMYLLSRNNAGTSQPGSDTGKRGFFNFDVWDGGTELLHYVPCVNQYGVARIYDTVSQNIITNNNLITPVLLTVQSTTGGSAKIMSDLYGALDSMYVTAIHTQQQYCQTPVRIKAIPSKGYEFEKWTDSNNSVVSTDIELWYKYPTTAETLTAHFVKIADQNQNNGFKALVFKYGRNYEDAYGQSTPEDPHQDSFASIVSGTVKEDMMQRCESTFILKDVPSTIKTDTVFNLFNSRGRHLYSGLVKSIKGNTITVREPMSFADGDFVFDTTTDTSLWSVNEYAYHVLDVYADGVTKFTDSGIAQNWAINKMASPYLIQREEYINVNFDKNFTANAPIIEELSTENAEDHLFNLANGFMIYFKSKLGTNSDSKKCLILQPINPYSMDRLTIGNNSEDFTDIQVEEEQTNDANFVLEVFNSGGTTLRALDGVMTDGTIKSLTRKLTDFLALEQCEVKVVCSDDKLNTLRAQYLSNATYNHKITFNVDLSKGTFRLDDFEIGRPIDFYMDNKLYRSMVTAREYSIIENNDEIKSAKITLGKLRTNLTSKLNLRKKK